MASGRLGSAYIGPKRTTQVYANSSGGAASLSVMAQAKSTTANTPISIKVDNGSIAAETETQIDSNSYNEQTLKLTYDSSFSSVTGSLAYDNYNTSGSRTMTLTPPTGTAIGTDRNYYMMPMCTNSDYTSWKGFESKAYYPVYNNRRAEFMTPAEATTAGDFNFTGAMINQNFTGFPTVSLGNNMTYNSAGVIADPYCNMYPIFSYQTNGYMSMRYINTSGSIGQFDRTSNSIFYWASGGGTNSSSYQQGFRGLFASGGMAGFVHNQSQYYFFRYYSKTPTFNNRMDELIEQNWGSLGSNKPLDIRFYSGATPGAGYPPVLFMEYDPHQDKIFVLQNVGSSTMHRKLYEWQPSKLEEYLADVGTAQPFQSTASGAQFADDYDRLESLGLAVDRTDNLPSRMKSNTLQTYAVLKRVQNKKWVGGFADPYASDTTIYYYQTTDFLTWEEIDSSEYYNEQYNDDITVASNGTVTNKLESNFNSLPDAGLLEYQTSVNNFERTGLVLSNNDKIYVRNHGDTGVAVSVMGYEE